MYKGAVVHVVVPAYNEEPFVGALIAALPPLVDAIVVVDDCSTDGTAAAARATGDPRVSVLATPRNLGVGGSVRLGYEHALAAGADVIVKMDGDGQMPPEHLPALLDAILEGGADYAKGNRFVHGEHFKAMPASRLVGNIVLTFLTKLASGYWHTFDPQNGYTAVRASALRTLNLGRLHRGFFFENDMLVQLNIQNRRVLDVPMPALYGDEQSSVRLPHVMLTFPPLLLGRFAQRVFIKYVVRDFSPIGLFLLCGVPAFVWGVAYGSYQWIYHRMTETATPTGTLMLILVAIVLGFQLILQAIVLDIAATPR
ncbi:MAG TPA: glycosyltransferase family 2 protein [Candidatus Binatia bacterium]|nr:glycosyltransferase family 2 protein [Candidatus Binatia bacterium]